MLWVLLLLWLAAEIDLRAFPARYYLDNGLAKFVIPDGLYAIAIGRHVICKGPVATAVLRAHEGRHVDQWRRCTIPVFLVLYAVFRARHGYEASPFEIEARRDAELMARAEAFSKLKGG